jgi:Zn finger protein HypA/HybF involved in hydrogenase expression
MLETEKFEIECPACRRNLEYTLKQLQEGRIVTCPNCGKKVRIEEGESGSVGRLENEIKDMVEKIQKKVTMQE